MRTITDTKNLFHEEFEYAEFINYAEKSKPSKKSIDRNYYESKTGSFNFTQTKNIGESFKLAKYGWDAGLHQIELEDGILTGAGIEFKPNVVGSSVNMGQYLIGQPLDMYEMTEKREFNLDELTVYVNLAYSCYNDGDKALNFCKTMLAHINELQSKYNLRIIGFFDCRQNGIDQKTSIIIKEIDERFTINNLAFSFHPSFFRRIWFKYLESKEFIASGYGRTTGRKETVDRIKKYHGIKKALIFPNLNDLTDEATFEIDKAVKINY